MSDGIEQGGVPRPLLRLIHGEATEEEIAAVLAVVLARSVVATATTPRRTSTWADPAARHRRGRTAFTTGPDGWRTSSWPH